MAGENGKIDVALAADRRYLPGLLATIASMIDSASAPERIRFNVFATGFGDGDEAKVRALANRKRFGGEIRFIVPDMAPIAKRFRPYKNSHMTYLRLSLCEYLQSDWAVYSDVDTLWFRDVCELWDERDENASVCWSRDLPSIAEGVGMYSRKWNPEFEESRYCCAGVMLMNLAKMRKSGFVDACARFAERWGTPFLVDQDILNTLCMGSAKILDRRWDLMMPVKAARDGAVLHFNGVGAMFSAGFSGWMPLHYGWFRYYNREVLGEPDRFICGRLKRLAFALMGIFYPPEMLIRALTAPFGRALGDGICRQLFFAWLWRHARWRRRNTDLSEG